MIDKNQIIEAKDLTREKVMVPEWAGKNQAKEGAFVYIRCLTGTERDAFESDIIRGKGKNADINMQNLRAKLLVRTMVNEGGTRLFADKEENILGAKNADVLDRLFAVAQKLSGLRKEDVEDLTKNLEATGSEDCATG